MQTEYNKDIPIKNFICRSSEVQPKIGFSYPSFQCVFTKSFKGASSRSSLDFFIKQKRSNEKLLRFLLYLKRFAKSPMNPTKSAEMNSPILSAFFMSALNLIPTFSAAGANRISSMLTSALLPLKIN